MLYNSVKELNQKKTITQSKNSPKLFVLFELMEPRITHKPKQGNEQHTVQPVFACSVFDEAITNVVSMLDISRRQHHVQIYGQPEG